MEAYYLQAVDQGAWILLGVIFIVVVASLWERERATALIRLMVLGCTIPILISAEFRDQNACASAWRWSAGAMFLLLSGLFGFAIRWFVSQDVSGSPSTCHFRHS